MTPDAFRDALATAGVSRPWLARATGYSRSAVDHWCVGRAPVPPELTAWLAERIAAPPPKRKEVK